MLGHRVLQRTFAVVFIVSGLGVAGQAAAQSGVPSRPVQAQSASLGLKPASGADDMAMPDDLGAPMAGGETAAADVPPSAAGGDAAAASKRSAGLSVNTPIAVIASSPQGRAVLERDLPGLCERPEYMIFKSMSPAKLAVLSSGRISQRTLTRLQAHLVQVSVSSEAEPPRHSLLAEGGTRVKRFSRSVYRRMLSAIEAL